MREGEIRWWRREEKAGNEEKMEKVRVEWFMKGSRVIREKIKLQALSWLLFCNKVLVSGSTVYLFCFIDWVAIDKK